MWCNNDDDDDGVGNDDDDDGVGNDDDDNDDGVGNDDDDDGVGNDDDDDDGVGNDDDDDGGVNDDDDDGVGNDDDDDGVGNDDDDDGVGNDDDDDGVGNDDDDDGVGNDDDDGVVRKMMVGNDDDDDGVGNDDDDDGVGNDDDDDDGVGNDDDDDDDGVGNDDDDDGVGNDDDDDGVGNDDDDGVGNDDDDDGVGNDDDGVGNVDDDDGVGNDDDDDGVGNDDDDDGVGNDDDGVGNDNDDDGVGNDDDGVGNDDDDDGVGNDDDDDGVCNDDDDDGVGNDDDDDDGVGNDDDDDGVGNDDDDDGVGNDDDDDDDDDVVLVISEEDEDDVWTGATDDDVCNKNKTLFKHGVYKQEGPFQVMVDINAVQELHCSTVGSLAGNLMLAHAHSDFPSDLVTIFEATGATLLIGFAIPIDKATMTVTSQPRLVYGGITYNFFRAENTEKFLVGKNLTDADTLKAALEILDNEVVPEPKLIAHNGSTVAYHKDLALTLFYKVGLIVVYRLIAHNGSTVAYHKDLALTLFYKVGLIVVYRLIAHNGSTVAYHKDLALTLFYKAYVGALGDRAPPRIQSAGNSILQERAVSSGIQNYDTRPDIYPVSKPMTKIAAQLQAAGEAEYVNDIPTREGEVYAAFVTSTKANCKIDEIDPSEALAIPGVIRFFDASDIPEGGVNELKYLGANGPSEGVFCQEDVLFVGHVLGIIVADTQGLADQAAKVVKVTYKDCKPLILTIAQAIEAKSFAPPMTPPMSLYLYDVDVGDAQGAMTSSSHVITGEVECGGQHHFHIETQVSLTVPQEDGLTVYTASQGITLVQQIVSEFLGVSATRLDNTSGVDVIVRRCGGAFGGKALRSCQVACASALAAKVLDRPVKLKMNFNANMASMGGRAPHMAKYKVAFNNEGVLQGVEMDYYADGGCTPEDNDMLGVMGHWDNLYYCPSWKISHHTLLTNKANTTYCRAPGQVQSVFIIESIMEHVAKALNKTPEEIREKNLYQEGQVNRWRKRGLVLVPGKYNVDTGFANFTVFVSIFASDGTVGIAHGGVEVGQGINVKVAQAASYVLGIPMDLIVIKPNHTMYSTNSALTGSSVGSEVCCKGTMECCKMLNERIKPIRDANPGIPWKQLITMCMGQQVDLSAKYSIEGALMGEGYLAYGVSCTEAEVDILTGERLILRSDILYDCGERVSSFRNINIEQGGRGLKKYKEVVGNGRFWRILKTDITKDINAKFDTSAYPKNHAGIKNFVNKKVIGMMKDETAGNEIVEFVGLRAKLYAYKIDNIEVKRCKGVKRSVVKTSCGRGTKRGWKRCPLHAKYDVILGYRIRCTGEKRIADGYHSVSE
ncbi:hypothetical protein QZH41_004418 [Actinostola sp. cb2023]|nr:hypothetical protein QZH41_004418 [Actinostola sp. cb2023]